MQGKRFAPLLLSALVAAALLVVAATSVAGGQAFTPSRSDIIFDKVQVGETSAPQTVTVRNASDAAVHYDQLTLVGPHPRDFLFSDDCAGRTIAAGEACEVHIRFRPTVEGTRVAHLRFDHDGSACSNWLTLAGSGPARARSSAAGCAAPAPAPTPAPAAPVAAAPVQQVTNSLANTAIGLPARSCRSRRAFRIHINPPRGIRFTKVTVKLNQRTIRVVRGRNIAADVSLRGLPRGRFTLRVVARTASGRVIQRDRHYVTCVRDKSAS